MMSDSEQEKSSASYGIDRIKENGYGLFKTGKQYY